MANLERPYIGYTDEQIDKMLREFAANDPRRGSVVYEREQRELAAAIHRTSRPHLVVWATFVVTVLTLLVCIIGYWPQVVQFVRVCRFWR